MTIWIKLKEGECTLFTINMLLKINVLISTNEYYLVQKFILEHNLESIWRYFILMLSEENYKFICC